MQIFSHFDGFCYRIRTKAEIKKKNDRLRLIFMFRGRKGLKLIWLAENFI